MEKNVKWLVGILFLVLFATAVLPSIAVGLKTITGDTTNFSAAEIAIYGLVGITVAIALVYKILKGSGMA